MLDRSPDPRAHDTDLINSSDVVKSRIQNTVRVKGVVPKYNWTLPSIAMVAREEGFAALYKGFLPKVLRLGPGGGMCHYSVNFS